MSVVLVLDTDQATILQRALKYTTFTWDKFLNTFTGPPRPASAVMDKMMTAVENAMAVAEIAKKAPALLHWSTPPGERYQEAVLGQTGDGVHFTLEHRPTCYRRGPWCLNVSVFEGPGHYKWGCFDDADQPTRFYHSEQAAKHEAAAIARVLHADREKVRKAEAAG